MTTILATLWNTGHRRQLLVMGALLALALLLTAGTIAWANSVRSAARLEHESLTSAWDANSAAAQEVSRATEQMPQQLGTAVNLRAAGFGRSADRVSWVEHTLNQLQSLSPLGYSVVAGPAASQSLPEALQSWFLERSLETPVFETNDMELQAQGLVESELLRVLQEAARAGGGITRTEHCKISRRADGAGLDAECRLRRYSLRKPPAEPAS